MSFAGSSVCNHHLCSDLYYFAVQYRVQQHQTAPVIAFHGGEVTQESSHSFSAYNESQLAELPAVRYITNTGHLSQDFADESCMLGASDAALSMFLC